MRKTTVDNDLHYAYLDEYDDGVCSRYNAQTGKIEYGVAPEQKPKRENLLMWCGLLFFAAIGLWDVLDFVIFLLRGK